MTRQRRHPADSEYRAGGRVFNLVPQYSLVSDLGEYIAGTGMQFVRRILDGADMPESGFLAAGTAPVPAEMLGRAGHRHRQSRSDGLRVVFTV